MKIFQCTVHVDMYFSPCEKHYPTVYISFVLDGKRWLDLMTLFDDCRVLNSDQHTSAEYIKQLLLSVVDEACQRAINHGLVPGQQILLFLKRNK